MQVSYTHNAFSNFDDAVGDDGVCGPDPKCQTTCSHAGDANHSTKALVAETAFLSKSLKGGGGITCHGSHSSKLDDSCQVTSSILDVVIPVQIGHTSSMSPKKIRRSKRITKIGPYPPNRLKELRDEKDLSLDDIADAIGSSSSQISKLERRERQLTLGWMNRLAPVLRVAPSALLVDPEATDDEQDGPTASAPRGRRGSNPANIGGSRPQHLYIYEWMTHKGLSDSQMATRLEMARNTFKRWRTEQDGLTLEKVAAIAGALGLESEELWHPPARESLDAIIKDAPAELHATVADIVKRLLKKVS